MSNIRHLASIDVGPDRKAPSEIQLWNKGENATDYGVHLWTERSVQLAFGEYQERGNLLGIDVEHGKSAEALAEKVTDEPPRMAGYAALEIRDGCPWLVFQWSDYGRQQIESGERRYLSPEYFTDADTREIISLVRVSLVAEPGTHRARLLCAKAQPSVGIIPAQTLRLPVAAKARTKAAKMDEANLALAGSVLLCLKAVVDGATDDGLKQWAQAVMDALMEKLGDQAQAAVDAASQAAPASQPAPEAAAAEVPDDKEEQKMAKRIEVLEAAVKALTSKLEAPKPAKPWVVSSAPTRTPSADATFGLTADELALCKAKKVEPQKYAASKAKMVGR